MAIDFPDSPSNGDTFTVGTKTWLFDGTAWSVITGAAILESGSVDSDKIADGAVTASKLGNDISFGAIHVEKFTDYEEDEWTCPADVTQIKLTLIGAGGASGDASASSDASSSSSAGPGDTAGSTTFVVGGTTYTALGGKKGFNDTAEADKHPGANTGSGSSAGSEADYNRYPGCGGAPLFASAFETTDDYTSRAKARSGRGQDGLTEVFQVTVVPATTYSFSIGLGAGFDGYFLTNSNMGSNGAVVIEYVL
jgi:hypothetical protein